MDLVRRWGWCPLILLMATQSFAADSALPNVTLPWGTWQANSLDPSTNIYSFENIRFGKPPNGTYRFNKSQRPDPIPKPLTTAMNSSYGPACHQVKVVSNCSNVMPVTQMSEDCLFLDIYVPQSVFDAASGINPVASTPVVVWFYGGAYEFGAKSAYGPGVPFYSGSGIMSTAQTNYSTDFIFVTGNYRLGAFGWLAGPTVEKKGLPNAGLYDQRLLLEWVQDYIHLFGGNKSHVSAWGESAGASSIMHHLLAFGGAQDPLFQYALVQSPAYQWLWNNSVGGGLDQVFDNFTLLANCENGDFDCVIDSSEESLVNANQVLYDNSYTTLGVFPVGPAIDDKWITELPQIAYSKGNVWKGLRSLVVSHVYNEAANFIPDYVSNLYPSSYYQFLNNSFPGDNLADVRNQISNNANYSGKLSLTVSDVQAIIQDSSFVCNTRFMFNTYDSFPNTSVYALYYKFADTYATHASDLLPTFYTADFNVTGFLEKYQCANSVAASLYAGYMIDYVAPIYQSYLADLAVYGDPNVHEKDVTWSVAATSDDGESVNDTLWVGIDGSFSLAADDENTSGKCGFWLSLVEQIAALMADEKADRIFEDVPASQQYLLDEL